MPDSAALDALAAHAAATAEPDHLDLRHLPPVPPIARPDRFSQTLLRHGERCKRAAYLYVRHHGGMPAHALDRGTVLHIAQAKVTNLILERHIIDHEPGGDVDYAVDEHTAKGMLDDVFAERPDLTVPLAERDQLREMMSHLANGFPINPAHIVAVERKFLLQLGPYTVSCVMDLAMIDGQHGCIRDYKTEWDVPAQADYEATFQGRLYAVALVYGQPVTKVPCEACKGRGKLAPLPPSGKGPEPCYVCEGRGTVERLEPPLGDRLTAVDVGEVFPRYLQEDGTVPVRSMPLPRITIDALRRDIEQLCATLDAEFASGEFPAVSGSHCKRCPCEPECPLPRHLRNFAGAIQTEAEAREAAEWWERVADQLKATREEIKSFCKVHGPLRYGSDRVFEFVVGSSRKIDEDGLQRAAAEAAQYGTPFDAAEYVSRKTRTDFKPRTLTGAELASEREAVES